MIRFPTKKDLQELQKYDQPLCLTIYAPVADHDLMTASTGIMIKNVIRQAEQAAISSGMDMRDIKKMLRPLRQLVVNNEFRPVRTGSIAIFAHPVFFRCYQIPNVEPHIQIIQTGFYLGPLERAVGQNQSYYVLALGHKNVRLFEGDRYDLEPVGLKGLPATMEKMLGIDEYPKSRELHAVAPADRGKGSNAFHEQYNVSQTDKTMLKEFFRLIDRRIHEYVRKHPKPLILAGVNYVLPIYREINTYPGLLDESIIGNNDDPDLSVLRKKAWGYIEQLTS